MLIDNVFLTNFFPENKKKKKDEIQRSIYLYNLT